MLTRGLLVLTGLCASLFAFQAPAWAEPFKCPDGFVVHVSVTPTEFTIALVCQGHMEPGDETPPPSASSSDPPAVAGTWVFDGYACENQGICADHEMCADGSIKKMYYFLSVSGERGESRGVCPGDADIPTVPKATPPTAGQIFEAFKSVVPPTAELSVQPPGGQTLVNFDTIFSTKAEPFTTGEIALVPGFKVVFEIFPTAFTWKFGDGQELKTDWAGKPWSEGVDVSTLITHAYTSKKDVKASVSITWGAKASLNGGEPVPVDGTVSVASAIVPLEVLEAVPQLVE